MHASIAERIAYGTPIDPGVDNARMPSLERSKTVLVGRILLAAIFITSGLAKLTDPGAAVGYMTSAGIPNPDVLVYVAGLAEVLGGIAVMFGFLARLGALGLVIYLIPVTYYFHGFWMMEGAEAKTQMVQFMKNLTVMGGLLLLFAHGPGRFSIDARLRRPLSP